MDGGGRPGGGHSIFVRRSETVGGNHDQDFERGAEVVKIIIEFEPGEVHPMVDGGDGGANYLAVHLKNVKLETQTGFKGLRFSVPQYETKFVLEGMLLSGEWTHYYPEKMPEESTGDGRLLPNDRTEDAGK